jgi:hypothetical protein
VPDFEIEGNPGNIRSRALTMEQKGQLFYDTGDALSKIDVSGWTGRAADEFREAHDLEPERWTKAGNGFTKAAAGLTTYAGALENAQSRAEWARKEYERGQRESESARTQYDAYMGRMRSYWSSGGTDQAEPFNDWGDPIQQEALTAGGPRQRRARLRRRGARRVCRRSGGAELVGVGPEVRRRHLRGCRRGRVGPAHDGAVQPGQPGHGLLQARDG